MCQRLALCPSALFEKEIQRLTGRIRTAANRSGSIPKRATVFLKALKARLNPDEISKWHDMRMCMEPGVGLATAKVGVPSCPVG